MQCQHRKACCKPAAQSYVDQHLDGIPELSDIVRKGCEVCTARQEPHTCEHTAAAGKHTVESITPVNHVANNVDILRMLQLFSYYNRLDACVMYWHAM